MKRMLLCVIAMLTMLLALSMHTGAFDLGVDYVTSTYTTYLSTQDQGFYVTANRLRHEGRVGPIGTTLEVYLGTTDRVFVKPHSSTKVLTGPADGQFFTVFGMAEIGAFKLGSARLSPLAGYTYSENNIYSVGNDPSLSDYEREEGPVMGIRYTNGGFRGDILYGPRLPLTADYGMYYYVINEHSSLTLRARYMLPLTRFFRVQAELETMSSNTPRQVVEIGGDKYWLAESKKRNNKLLFGITLHI